MCPMKHTNSALDHKTKLANALKTILPSALEELVSKDADYGLVSKKLDEFRRVLSDVDLTVADIDGIVRRTARFSRRRKRCTRWVTCCGFHKV